MGELTLIGQQQARDLGTWLRQRYVDQYGFLSPDMQVTDVHLQLGRGVPCAAGLLCGL